MTVPSLAGGPAGDVAGSTPAAPALTTATLIDWLGRFHDAVHTHSGWLTELDSAIGDADHGANLTRGMDAVVASLDPALAIGPLLQRVGMTLVTSVGGASGPLYGTFFLRAATAAGDFDRVDGARLLRLLRAGLDGIVARGRAEPGDKTMYDALAPGLQALEAALGSGGDLATSARAAADAAAAGRDATEPLLAHKGRASYLGERSIGHIDPGAASAALLLRALADTLAQMPDHPR